MSFPSFLFGVSSGLLLYWAITYVAWPMIVSLMHWDP